jgi:hypothetical protein
MILWKMEYRQLNMGVSDNVRIRGFDGVSNPLDWSGSGFDSSFSPPLPTPPLCMRLEPGFGLYLSGVALTAPVHAIVEASQ